MKKAFIIIALAVDSMFFATIVNGQQGKKMIAHFINVDQADATLLEFPCGAILIDAGAKGPKQATDLIAYLSTFFARRVDLNTTLDLVIVTHAHIDHNFALDQVANKFVIKRYIDNGLTADSGRKNQNWLRKNAMKRGVTYANYPFAKITKDGNAEGITDTVIDPLNCDAVDPEIVLLSGSFSKKPAEWKAKDFNNGTQP